MTTDFSIVIGRTVFEVWCSIVQSQKKGVRVRLPIDENVHPKIFILQFFILYDKYTWIDSKHKRNTDETKTDAISILFIGLLFLVISVFEANVLNCEVSKPISGFTHF